MAPALANDLTPACLLSLPKPGGSSGPHSGLLQFSCHPRDWVEFPLFYIFQVGPRFLVRLLRGLHSERLSALPEVAQQVRRTRMPEFSPSSNQCLPFCCSVQPGFPGNTRAGFLEVVTLELSLGEQQDLVGRT